MLFSRLPGIGRLRPDASRQFRVERFQYAASDSKGRCEFSGGTGDAGGGIHAPVPPPLLRFPGAEIHRTRPAAAPAVIGLILRRTPHAHVVAVVGQLVVKLARSRVHPVQPVQPPADLVHDVRDAVGARGSVGPECIAKSLRVALVGIGHLVDGIGGGGGVLQAVRGIVPPAAHVQVLAAFGGMIDNDGVLRVAAVAQEGIPPAALLAHVMQHEIGRPVIDLRADGEAFRTRIARDDPVRAGGHERGKIEPGGGRHLPQGPRGNGFRPKHRLAAEHVHHLEFLRCRCRAQIDGHFRGPRKVAQLVGPDDGPSFLAESRQGKKDRQEKDGGGLRFHYFY